MPVIGIYGAGLYSAKRQLLHNAYNNIFIIVLYAPGLVLPRGLYSIQARNAERLIMPRGLYGPGLYIPKGL